MIRVILAFIVAALIAGAASTAALAHFQLDQMARDGLPTTWGERLPFIASTLGGMGPLATGLIAVSLLVCLLVGRGMAQLLGPASRTPLLALAGAVAVPLVFLAVPLALPLFRLYGAETPLELGAQALVGLAAGAVFARLAQPR
jgi:hypothetical protein